MMTEEHIKESISLKYLELIAANGGYKTMSSYPDYGTDLEVKEVGFRTNDVKKRFLETGRELKFQLKSTTEDNIVFEGNSIKYDLNSDTYNDLIQRKKSKTPLILVLFILPSNKEEWLAISDKELVVKKCAYWFIPEDNHSTNNHSSIRIEIKKDNLIKKDTLNYLFNNFS